MLLSCPFFFFLMTGNCYDLYVCAGKGMRMKSGFLFYSPFGWCCSAKSAFDCGVVICRSINDVIVWIRKIRRSFVHSREVLCYQSFSGQIQKNFWKYFAGIFEHIFCVVNVYQRFGENFEGSIIIVFCLSNQNFFFLKTRISDL